jgi:hypothetical protein
LIAETDISTDPEYTHNLTVEEDTEAVYILDFNDEYAADPVYITKQKIMSSTQHILLRGGAFLRPYIVTE